MYPKRLDYQVIAKENEPVAETTTGRVRGLRYKEVCVFKGIPYAKAQRYHAPVPADPWDGTLDCTCYGPVCSETETLLPKDAWLVPHYWYLQSEHCQNLNIWTKHLGDNAARPVLVLLHGDGYAHGSSIERFAADGEEFCDREDVVVVSVNHRLNCLGYLDLSDFSEDYAGSGNLGTADLVAALKWVHDNAAAFGGNPNRVMLYGLAGGGGKGITLLQTPAADGLYHCCAIHSGVTPSRQDVFPSKDSTKAAAKLIVEALGYTKENIREIETLPFFKLAKAVTDVSKKLVETN